MVGRLVRGLGAALVAAVFAFVLFLPTQVPARPELGARINSGCWKCHVNPTGGGMRNQKGLQSSNNLSLSASKDALAEKYPEFLNSIRASARTSKSAATSG
ncbi:MAG: hypothetical protein M5R36_12345 [Deltaproteobacteria bacterium]|nr:hypothetical protein [Deltaproteobacteria bacterium]